MVNFAQLMKNVPWQAETVEPRPAGQSTQEGPHSHGHAGAAGPAMDAGFSKVDPQRPEQALRDVPLFERIGPAPSAPAQEPPVRDDPPCEGPQTWHALPAVRFPQRPLPEDDVTGGGLTQSVESKLSAVEKLSALLDSAREAGDEGVEAGGDDRGVDIDKLADDIVANLADVIASAPTRDESERTTAGADAPRAESPETPVRERAVAEPVGACEPHPVVPEVSLETFPQSAVEPSSSAIESAEPARGTVDYVPAAAGQVEPVPATRQAEPQPPIPANGPARETPPLKTEEDIENAFSYIASAMRASSDLDGRAAKGPRDAPPEADAQGDQPLSARIEGRLPDVQSDSTVVTRQAQPAFKPIEETGPADFNVVEGSLKPVSPAGDSVVPGDMTWLPKADTVSGAGGAGIPAPVPESGKTLEPEGGIERQNILDEMMKIMDEIGPSSLTVPAGSRPAGDPQPPLGASAVDPRAVQPAAVKPPEVPTEPAPGTQTGGPVAVKLDTAPARAVPADPRHSPKPEPVAEPRTGPAESPAKEAPSVPAPHPASDADGPAGRARATTAVAGFLLYLPKVIVRAVMEFVVALGEGLFGKNSIFGRMRRNMDFVASVMTCLIGIVWFISATVSGNPWLSLGLGAVFFVPSFGWLLLTSLRRTA
jgi:hypothetical protein